MEKLADGRLARAVLGALQAQRRGTLDFESVRALVAELFADEQRDSARATVQYSTLRADQINEIIATVVPPEHNEPFVSTADALIEKGLQRGLTRARQDNVIEALEVRFGGLPGHIRDVVEAVSDLQQLSTLHKQAILCARRAEFGDAAPSR